MSVEMALRSLWVRVIRLTLPRPAPDAVRRARRVLFLRHDAIGDMLSSLGVIRALVEHGLEVDVLASRANAAVLADNPWDVGVLTATRIRGARTRLKHALRARRYDAVIDGLVLKPRVNSRTIRLLRACRAPVRIGIGGRVHASLYTHPVAADLSANHVEVLAALLTPFGISTERALEPVPMPLTESERGQAEAWWNEERGVGPRLFVNISASSAERRWPDERYMEVLQGLVAGDPSLRVAVTGSPADWPAAETIALACGGRAATGALRAAFALVASSDVVLTPDTSVAHAAAGFQVPSVVLTLPGNLRFAPWRAPGVVLVSSGDTLVGIAADTVLSAVRAQLAAREGDPR